MIFYVIHLAKRDNKGCVPNLHIKILPFPISLSQNVFTNVAINFSSYTWDSYGTHWMYDITNLFTTNTNHMITQTRQSNN